MIRDSLQQTVSGTQGSTHHHTGLKSESDSIANDKASVVKTVIEKYNLRSLLDAACGKGPVLVICCA